MQGVVCGANSWNRQMHILCHFLPSHQDQTSPMTLVAIGILHCHRQLCHRRHLLVGYMDIESKFNDKCWWWKLGRPATLRDSTRRMKHLRYLRWWTISGGQSTILYLVFIWVKGGSLPSSKNKDGINDNSGGWCCQRVWLQTSPWSMEVQRDSRLEQMAMKGAFVKVQSNGCFGIFKRPLQWLYPLEVRSVENASSASHMSDDTPQSDTFPSPQGASDSVITAGEPEVKMIWMRTDIWTNFVSNYSIHFFIQLALPSAWVIMGITS